MNAAPVSAQAPVPVTPAASPSGAPAPLVAPPYSLDPVGFALPALAEAAGTAPLGGDREMALGAFMVARLMLAALPPTALPLAERTVRADRARHWLTALTMPQPARMALLRAMDASVATGFDAAAALRELAQVLAGHVSQPALAELVTLGDHLRLYYEQTP